MASIVVDDDFSIDGLYEHLQDQLPKYSVPLFIRISEEIEKTGTFKYKKVDLATNNTENIYDRLKKTNPKAFKNLKEIWRSPLIPSDPMVWRKDLNMATKEKLAYFFLQYGRFGDLRIPRRTFIANAEAGVHKTARPTCPFCIIVL